MGKFFVPGLLIFAISGLAFTLIAVVIARSPYTHGNLTPENYNRTAIIFVGEETPFEGLGLAGPHLVSTGDAAQDGRALFFKDGCASCHGLQAQGGAVGPDLLDASASKIRREVREGPAGMPAYSASSLSDEDVEKIIAFLKSQ